MNEREYVDTNNSLNSTSTKMGDRFWPKAKLSIYECYRWNLSYIKFVEQGQKN